MSLDLLAIQRQAWLQAATQRYAAEPSAALSLLPEARAQFESWLALPPDALHVELALLIYDLAIELRNVGLLEAIAPLAMRWCEAGLAPESRIRVQCMQARVEIHAQRIERASALIERASALASDEAPPLDRACVIFVLGMLASRQLNPARAASSYADAIRLFRSSGHHGPWVQAYAGMSTAYRELGQQEARLAALREGVEQCLAQRRWAEAANLSTGLIDVALEQQDTDAAEQALSRAQQLADQADPSGDSAIHDIVRHGRACCLAQRSRFDEAAALGQAALERRGFHIGPMDLARRCDQVSDWLMRAGQTKDALALARRGQQALEEMAQAATQREQMQLRQRMELAHIETQRRRGEQQARELEQRNAGLEQALALQRELQDELVDSLKFASLGQLLAGVARELSAPLQQSLAALERVQAPLRTLQQTLQGQPTRGQLRALHLQAVVEQAQAQEALERALALVAAYRQLEQPQPRLQAVEQAVEPLVRAAWRRAISPDSRLQLILDAPERLPVDAEAVAELLQQLLQNVERHAYAPNEPGSVRVQLRAHEGWLHLIVSDQGRGIAAERLAAMLLNEQLPPRGRTGLGLFIARAAVQDRLGGRFSVGHNPGGGCRVEARWPLRLQR